MLEGQYSGVAGSGGGSQAVLGTNIPASKLSLAGWDVAWTGYTNGNGTTYRMDFGNRFQIGRLRANAGPWEPALTPADAWNIDSKIDDGKPGLGQVVAARWNNECATGGADETDLADSVYNLASDTLYCSLYFVRLF